MLVATSETFAQPQTFVFAFDGSSAAFRTLELIKTSPLLAGLKALVVTAGVEFTLRLRQLEEAKGVLVKAGFEAHSQLIAGETDEVLSEFVKSQGAQLLVMGAFGHSWLNQ